MAHAERGPAPQSERPTHDQIIDKLQHIPPDRWERFKRTVPVSNPLGTETTRTEVGFQTLLPNRLILTLTRDATKKVPRLHSGEEKEDDVVDKKASDPVPQLSFAMYLAGDNDPLEIIAFPQDSVRSRRDDSSTAPQERQIAQRAYGFFSGLERAVKEREKARRSAALESAHRIFTNMPPKN